MKGYALRVIATLALLGFVMFGSQRTIRPAIIQWNVQEQVIDGFGASCADFNEPLPPGMADFFFTTSGIGLSLLRIQVIPSEADCQKYFASGGGNCLEVSSGATILKGELAVAKQATARGVTVWATPWSPPATFKSNGSFVNGGRLLRSSYPEWAKALAEFVTLLETNGVQLKAISVQNEPDLSTNYGSAQFSAQELHDFVPYLHSALGAQGAGKTQIIIAETSHWNFGLTSTSMADPEVAKDVGILAAHGYGASGFAKPHSYGKHVWQTEDSSQSPVFDGSMADALSWALKIHRYLTEAEVNAWHWWFLSDGSKYGNGIDNSALTDINQAYPKRAYAIGQWSKFVRPGWYRVRVEYIGPLRVSAFKSSAGKSFAIVVINESSKSVQQSFAFEGVTSDYVEPWITSPSKSLELQTPVPVEESEFTYSLPASSVTTFVGTQNSAQ